MKPEYSADVGKLNNHCPHCKALYFDKEMTSKKVYSKCCKNGRVKLTPIFPSPLIAKCLDRQSEEGKTFLDNSLQLANFTAISSVNYTDPDKYYNIIKMHGQVYSCIDGICGETEKDNRFLASYWFIELNEHKQLSTKQRNLIYKLREEIKNYHPIIKSIVTFADTYGDLREIPLFDLQFTTRPITDSLHKSVWSKPQYSNEVGLITSTDTPLGEDILPKYRAVNIKSKATGKLMKVPSDNQFYDVLAYPLLCMNMCQGWHRDLKDTTGQKITIKDYYRYYYHTRDVYNRPLSDMQVFIISKFSFFLLL